MANKQYISPIQLFEFCHIDHNGDINLSRIRKQLSVEFDFAKSGFIETGGYSYNKNDIFEEIERPDFLQRLQFHERLWQNKNILGLLENNTVNINQLTESFTSFQGDKDFDEFFSPYFAGPFNNVSRKFLSAASYNDVGTLLLFEEFLQPQDREEAFKAIRIFLEDNIQVFKNINSQNYGTFLPKLQHWTRFSWYSFLDNLPDEFYYLKNKIVVDLVNFTIKLQRSHKEDCKTISYELRQLQNIPDDLKQTIYSNHKVYTNTNSSSSSTGGYGWIIGVIILLLKVVVFSRGCR